MRFYLGGVLDASKINLMDQSKWLLSTPKKRKAMLGVPLN